MEAQNSLTKEKKENSWGKFKYEINACYLHVPGL